MFTREKRLRFLGAQPFSNNMGLRTTFRTHTHTHTEGGGDKESNVL